MKVEEWLKSGAGTAEFGGEINPPPKSQLISSERRQTLNSLSTLCTHTRLVGNKITLVKWGQR